MNDKQALHRDFKGIWIHKELWLRKDLSITEKCLLAEIDSLDQGKGCFASDEYLAEFFNISKSTLAHWLTRLRKKGLVKSLSFDGRKRFLRVIFPSPRQSSLVKTGKAGLSELTEPNCQNEQAYNKEDKKEITATRGRCGNTPSLLSGDDLQPVKIQPISSVVKTYHKFAVLEEYHIVRKDEQGRNVYAKGSNNSGWGRQALAFWEMNYQALLNKYSAERIEKVLNWFISNHRNPYVPNCHTFLTFCKKFPSIEKTFSIETEDKQSYRNGESNKPRLRAFKIENGKRIETKMSMGYEGVPDYDE